MDSTQSSVVLLKTKQNRIIDQSDIIDMPEINSHSANHLIFDKGDKNIPLTTDGLFTKGYTQVSILKGANGDTDRALPGNLPRHTAWA